MALAGEASFTLHTHGLDTGAAPTVVYRPQAPGAAQAPIEFTTGGLDGATVTFGESRTFNVEVTRVEGGGFAIVLLSDQPDFVTVQNTGLNRATITVNAAHASATVGQHTFTVMAATGSDPASRQVTVTIAPAA